MVPLHLAASNVLPGLSWGRFMESKRKLQCHHLHEVPSNGASVFPLSAFCLRFSSNTFRIVLRLHSACLLTPPSGPLPLCALEAPSCGDSSYGFRSVRFRLESDLHLRIVLCPVSAPSLDGGAESAESSRCRSGGQTGAGESCLTDMNWMSVCRHYFLLVPNMSG